MSEYEVVQHQQLDSISLFFNTVDYRVPHFHEEWELIWVLDQPLAVACGQRRFVLQPNELVLFSPKELHEFHREKGDCTFLCLQISSDILPGVEWLYVDGLSLNENMSEEDLQWIRSTLRSAAKAYFSRENHYELLCMGQCSLIMHRLLTRLPCRPLSRAESESIGRRNTRLERFLQFVDENYMRKICLADFAAQEGCSVSYLSHFIKENLHQTFREYVNTIRFNCACKLITRGNRKMLEVCYESGFSDYRYFSAMFRRQFGITPEQYCRQVEKGIPQQSLVRHSAHSVERFYSVGDSLELLDRLTK